MKKKIVFLTGTRADYGKIKSLIFELQNTKSFKTQLIITGMHNLKKYGNKTNIIFRISWK